MTAMPNINALMLPYLKLLGNGEEHTVSETGPLLAAHFNLPQFEWEMSRSRDIRGGLYQRFGWVRTYLKKAGLIKSPRRGVFKITDRGMHILSLKLKDIGGPFIKQLFELDRPTKEPANIKRRVAPGSAPIKMSTNRIGIQGRPDSNLNRVKFVAAGRGEKNQGIKKISARMKAQSNKALILKLEGKASTDEPYHVVEVFFGTDRATINAQKAGQRFTNARGELKLGVCTVSMPSRHAIGELESPKWFRLEFKENPAKHVVLLEAEFLTQQAFTSRLKTASQNSTQSAFVFVHGFNVSFENAARRTAQIAADLGFKTIPGFFSWPSQSSLKKYDEDAGNIEWTEPNLEKFLSIFAEKTQVKEIFVIAHSMGTRAVTRVMSKLLSAKATLQAQFKELILAAPDIDAAVFKDVLLPAIAANQQTVTMYSSSKDKALNWSKKFTAHPRAGDSKPGPVVGQGLETIDASKISTDFLGHSYFAKERPLLTDLALLVNNGIRAAERPTLQMKTSGKDTYWSFKA